MYNICLSVCMVGDIQTNIPCIGRYTQACKHTYTQTCMHTCIHPCQPPYIRACNVTHTNGYLSIPYRW